MKTKLLFNKESKSGAWEITFDKEKNKGSLFYFAKDGDFPLHKIKINSKDFSDLKELLIETELPKKQRIIDTSRGYTRKPKPAEGYKVESYYCECGCKKGYWHYVKI